MVLDVEGVPQVLADSGILIVSLGVALLMFGRRLYFLLLGTAGFAVGIVAASSAPMEALGVDSSVARLAIALGAGIVAAALAFVLHRVVLAGVGLAAGGLGGFWLAEAVGGGVAGWWWLLPVGAAVAGAALLPSLYEIALVALSSWVGAALVMHAVPLHGPAAALAALGIFGTGLWIQTRLGGREHSCARGGRCERRRRRDERRDEATAAT